MSAAGKSGTFYHRVPRRRTCNWRAADLCWGRYSAAMAEPVPVIALEHARQVDDQIDDARQARQPFTRMDLLCTVVVIAALCRRS